MGFLHDAKQLNLDAGDVADATAKAGQLPVTGGGRVTSVSSGSGGTVVNYEPESAPTADIRHGRIVDAGPNGEDDFDDARYWVTFEAADAGAVDAALALEDASGEYPDDLTLPVTNLAEWDADTGGTHTLATDGTQRAVVFAQVDVGGSERYVMSVSPGGAAIKWGVMGDAWPGGTNAITLTPCVSETDDTPLTDGDGDPLPDVDCYIQVPVDVVPSFFAANAGDILAYVETDAGNNVLLQVPFPAGTTLYDVPQIVAVVGGVGVGGVGPLRAQ